MRNENDLETDSDEYEFGYDIIRWAMTQFDEPDLECLRNALHKASVFVNQELEEMEDETTELGLDKWLKHEEEKRAEQEEEDALAAQGDESQSD